MANTPVLNTDRQGKYCLLTGATSGIGEQTALALANAGVRLYLLCRSRDKGEALQKHITATVANASVELLIADLNSLTEVRRVAAEFLAAEKPLHLLINNAGIVNNHRQLSADGYEQMFAVNHLAPFLLTNLLLERLKESSPAWIVNVSSGAHAFVRDMGFDDLQAEKC